MSSSIRIVSGGQSGVDRAALDAALALGIEIGGWCPAGRWAEDGPIPTRYPLRETDASDPADRTRRNVRDSDATLILMLGPPCGGTALTLELAKEMDRPHQLVDLKSSPSSQDIVTWIRRLGVQVLNVAGPRESEVPGIYGHAFDLLTQVLRSLSHGQAAPAQPVR